MAMFNVVINYEGSCDFEIEAKSEEEARKIAEQKFGEIDIGDLNGVDWRAGASWKIPEKAPSLSDQIAGANARQASQADNKTQPGHEQGR